MKLMVIFAALVASACAYPHKAYSGPEVQRLVYAPPQPQRVSYYQAAAYYSPQVVRVPNPVPVRLYYATPYRLATYSAGNTKSGGVYPAAPSSAYVAPPAPLPAGGNVKSGGVAAAPASVVVPVRSNVVSPVGVSQVRPGASVRYHAQDELGQYQYGYASADGQSKTEIRGIDGSVAGRYSYVDPLGKHVEVSYVADKDGFRAAGDHLPKGPVIPDDLREAYEEAYQRLAEAKARNAAKQLYGKAQAIQQGSYYAGIPSGGNEKSITRVAPPAPPPPAPIAVRLLPVSAGNVKSSGVAPVAPARVVVPVSAPVAVSIPVATQQVVVAAPAPDTPDDDDDDDDDDDQHVQDLDHDGDEDDDDRRIYEAKKSGAVYVGTVAVGSSDDGDSDDEIQVQDLDHDGDEDDDDKRLYLATRPQTQVRPQQAVVVAAPAQVQQVVHAIPVRAVPQPTPVAVQFQQAAVSSGGDDDEHVQDLDHDGDEDEDDRRLKQATRAGTQVYAATPVIVSQAIQAQPAQVVAPLPVRTVQAFQVSAPVPAPVSGYPTFSGTPVATSVQTPATVATKVKTYTATGPVRLIAAAAPSAAAPAQLVSANAIRSVSVSSQVPVSSVPALGQLTLGGPQAVMAHSSNPRASTHLKAPIPLPPLAAQGPAVAGPAPLVPASPHFKSGYTQG